MFDPTAFENLKVVVEGNLYDRDLDGEIMIIDRNDFMNMAKLSRRYEVSFSDCQGDQNDIFCELIIEAELQNLAAELLKSAYSEKLAGCQIFTKFHLNIPNDPALFQRSEKILQEIWGTERIIELTGKINLLKEQNMIKMESIVIFNRLIYEDQIDDLYVMIEYMIKTIKSLRANLL